MLRDEHERVGEVVAGIVGLSTLQEIELRRVGLLGRQRPMRTLQLRARNQLRRRVRLCGRELARRGDDRGRLWAPTCCRNDLDGARGALDRALGVDVERRGRTRCGEQQERGDGKGESSPTPRGRGFRDRQASGCSRPRDRYARAGEQPRAHHVGRSSNVPSLFDDRLHLLLSPPPDRATSSPHALLQQTP